MKLNNLALSVPFEVGHQTEFQIESGSKTVRLSASKEKTRNDWYEAAFSAIEQYRETRMTSSFIGEVEEKPVEEKISHVKPVPFPKDLADTCQVRTPSSPISFYASRCTAAMSNLPGTVTGVTTASVAEPLFASNLQVYALGWGASLCT